MYPPQQPMQQPYPPPAVRPPNYLVWSILSTIFCCLPFGIVSIVYAAQVDGKVSQGDYAGAVAASNNAKRWAIIAAVSAIVILIIYFILILVGAATLSFTTSNT